ncbi:MAG TPA: ROK family transcriptional regulator [Pyrinomonadaceae bacterium]|jgi:predicted NBD/HSP70 family sugar kinase|nr:ROK family transcriptional regulator [Pyrinomonadaceae bacterium]
MRRINLNKASVARSDTIRNINRQIVLNYVRERAPISRAEISHETELQRSTVSLIVEELKDRGLVAEIEGESTGGRPPLLLQLKAAGPIAIGVDLSTEQTVIATSDLAGRVLTQKSFATDASAEKTLKKVVDCVNRLVKADEGVEAIGVSLPGLVDPETGNAVFIPHFRWRDFDVADRLRAATGLPVKVDNDANAAALAELWFGRPEVREVRNFVMILVEEGLGTGIVFDGQVYHGEAGAAGEFGHMTIGSNAPVACAAGGRECWEAFASERAALARYAKLSGRDGGGAGVSFKELVGRALDGEKAAQTALLKTAHYLGVGISNVIKGLSPEAVIVGGEMARAWPLVSADIKKAVERNNICRGLQGPRIIPSTLGEAPRLMGALSLVLSRKFAAALTS